jgi:glyoxylase-like metal-dependent hydrolase (beta-lactamase superfamily II)
VRNYQPQQNPTMTKLADGVYSFEIGTYKSIAVEFPKYIAVFEAPRNEDFSLRVIEAIAKQIPNKPIRYLINSHQHSDAAGGMRTYSHIGATFVTSWHNYDYYRHDFINYNPRTIRPDIESMAPPTELAEGYFWEAVRENYTIEDQGRVMHVYYANPLQHAEGMLYAYLPKEKMLLESDIINTNNPLPAMPTRDMTTLHNNVKALKLDVQQIVPMHGKPMPWSDFDKMFPAQPRQTASTEP